MGGPGQPYEVLEGEPGDADGLDHGQGGVVDCVAFGILVLQTGKGAYGHPDNRDRDKDGGKNLWWMSNILLYNIDWLVSRPTI